MNVRSTEVWAFRPRFDTRTTRISWSDVPLSGRFRRFRRFRRCSANRSTASESETAKRTAKIVPSRNRWRRRRNRSCFRPEWDSCRAPSCASAATTGACTTCRIRAPCSCTACPMCARASASCDPNCWRTAGRSRRIRT